MFDTDKTRSPGSVQVFEPRAGATGLGLSGLGFKVQGIFGGLRFRVLGFRVYMTYMIWHP